MFPEEMSLQYNTINNSFKNNTHNRKLLLIQYFQIQQIIIVYFSCVISDNW